MTQAQKIIKYLAIAFAFSLIVTIISVALGGIYMLITATGLVSSNENILLDEMTQISDEVEEISSLKIEIKAANLQIKSGEIFKVETNNSQIKYSNDNGNISINENDIKMLKFNSNYNSELVIYLPENMNVLNDTSIEAGAGRVTIDSLETEELKLNLGAGEVIIKDINVSNKTKINGGAGILTIKTGKINNVDLDLGIGETDIQAAIEGKSKVNAGIGNVKLKINDIKEHYKINIDKGIGNIKVDGENLADDKTIGNGNNYIKIDGGIGNINIDFIEK